MIPSTAISVVIPSYNRLASTLIAFKSVLDQTALPGEIIIVDDASDAAYREDDFVSTDVPVRLIRHRRNRGAAAARQTGVNAASGHYIAFLDSDDYWLPEKLESQLPLLPALDSPLVVVSCAWRAVEGGLKKHRVRLPIGSDDPTDFLCGCWFSPGSTAIIPRQAFNLIGPFNTELKRLEDLEFFARLAQAGGQLKVSPVVGAVITINRRNNIASIDTACATLSTHFRAKLNRTLARQLDAYLLLERAAARRNIGDVFGVSLFLLRSFIKVPRRSLHLRSFWAAHN